MRFGVGKWAGVAVVAALVCAAPTAARATDGHDDDRGPSGHHVEWPAVLVAPSDLQVTDTKKNAVRVSWSRDDGGLDHVRYRVYSNGVLQLTTDDDHATVSGLDCATSYAIGVASVDASGHTSATSTVLTGTDSCTGGLRIVLSAPQYIDPGALLRADTNGDSKSVSFGYCPGATCSWASATTIGTVRGDDDTQLRWRTLPSDGRYTLLAHAVDQRGRSADSAPITVTVDGTPPHTTITSGPAPFVNTTSASFTFGASEPVSGFECSLDNSHFAACGATLSLTGLEAGAHALSVRSIDLAGNVDPTPPSLTWTIDRTAPKTTIVSGPPTRTTSTTASFALSANEPSTFGCSLDGGAFTACTAAPVFNGLGVGTHRFVARAIDRAGNVDPSPPAWSWTIDPPAGPVQVTITSAPSGTVASRSATVSFSSNYAGATFECALDASAYAVCASPASLTSLSDGPHAFLVRAVAIDGTRSTPASASWVVDTTGPAVTLSPSRPPESSGWYRSSVTFTTTGSDAGGVVSCTPPQTYSGPDASRVTITGTCVDAVGNTGTATAIVSYDATSPSVTLSPSRSADSNGWYNHALSFVATATDATSGSPVCVSPSPYAGPDGAHVTVSASCTDAAGNVGTASLSFAYDATAPAVVAAPSRASDHGEWYNAPFSVSFSATDTMSGGVHCDAPVSFGGPDGSALSVSGSCSDAAGNSRSATFAFKYDATAPTVSASPDRAPDRNGWFNHSVTVSFAGVDSTSGGVTCDAPKSYSAPDSATASLSGNCTDAAGNVASASFSFKYDATAPTVNASPDRPADHNGWYNHPLTVSFAGSDTSSGGLVCDPAVGYHTDSASALVAGTCMDAAGNVGTGTFGFSYDATAPSVTASTDRAADHNGWFNHPVTVSFTATDALSGVTCDPAVTYHADSVAANVSGSCSDGAGNTAGSSVSLEYDATPPSVTASPSRPADVNGWYNHPLSVSFAGTDATSGGVVCDAPVGYGTDAGAASIGGSCTDAAGNSASAHVALRYDATAPSVTATPSRPADANGWYNHALQVSFSGSDALSGGVQCDSPVTYGTDAAAATITGSCTDAAGNTGAGPFSLKYDGSAPHVTPAADRAPDHNGWYNHPLSVSFSATDDLSGEVVCAPAVLYATDDVAASVSGSCIDAAGNQASASLSLKYDATAPSVTASPDRSPDSNGWFNHPLLVSFVGSDSTSGGVSCDPAASYSTDSAAGHVSGSCTDAAGNTGSASLSLQYDGTAPSVTANAGRPADSNGWYNHPLSVSFSGSDPLSGGVTCDPAVSYSTDAATAHVSGSCTDAAGNSGSDSLALKYDSTAPSVTAAAGRSADRNGWYNHPLSVSFSGTDALSGGVSCDPGVSYSTDSASAHVSGSCTDAAGNSGSDSLALKYDGTAPLVTAAAGRPADSNGWYNHPLSVSFSGTDALSGGVSCDPGVSYSTDSASAHVSGSCTDAAGNSGSDSLALKYDGTAPLVTAAAGRSADSNGWYNHPLSVSFSGTDALSGGVVCDPAVSYSTDAATAHVAGTCTDAAGNGGSDSLALKYDATAPSVTAAADRPADSNGWYNHPLSVSFSGTDALSGGVVCDPATSYSTDSAAAHVSGSCTDAAGNSGSDSLTLKYDATAPTVTATPDRPADSNGWYNHPLSISFGGLDGLSGGVVCDPATSYSTDSAAALVAGTCVDAAGNVGNGSFGLSYDGTAPSVTAAADRPADSNGWYNHPLSVSFSGTDALSGGVVCDPAAGYSTDSAAAHVSGSCTDAAGNSGSDSLALKYDSTAPSVTASPGRSADVNGWYNHPLSISFGGSDGLSGGVSCDPAVGYSTDSAAALVAGTCVDAAGNVGNGSFGLSYDGTAPSVAASADRQADSNGWYNHPLSISFTGTDALSGGVTCDPAASYSTDSAAAHVSGSCTDAAGNSGSDSLALKYDSTAPSVTAAADRPADSNGWYNHPLSVSFIGTDDLSGGVSCEPAVGYSTDSATTHVSGSCTDAAGNSGSDSLALKYDSTAPSVTAAADRPPDSNGWYNHPLSVSFGGTDALSGGVSCDPGVSYSTDSASAHVSGSCTDAAGNSSSDSVSLKYDSTAPLMTAAADRPADSNGWYNHPLSVSFSGTDGLSGGVVCDPVVGYSTDAASAHVAGSCTDAAGNSSSDSVALKYDSTAPSVTATADRPADSNGWYNHPLSVSFSGTDGLSGGVTCDPTAGYSTDAAAAHVSGSCTDAAGNKGSDSLALKYDATAPTVTASPDRSADHNGWYNHPLSVSFSGSDALSGGVICDPAASYSTDSAAALVAGTCIDAAGNVGNASFGLSYDGTAPSVAATPDRSPDSNGWYNHPLSVSFSGSDGLSGGVTCDPAASYSTDSASASVTGSCIDAAGNTASASLPVLYDSTAPDVVASPDRGPDHNGWYNHAVLVSYLGTDGTSGIGSCTLPETYFAPDTSGAIATGSCTDVAGNSSSGSVGLQYDATPPAVTALASRAPDSNGWYNHAVSVAFGGTDATSGGVVCDAPVSYGGPDDPAAAISGSCTDAAGNSATNGVTLSYDATAPSASVVLSRPADHNGWYNHPLDVSLVGADGVSGGVLCTATQTFAGPDTGSALVGGTCTDAAGNTAGATRGLSYDATAPVIDATPSRQPNANGWYNAALQISFAGSDATSGLESCSSPASYSGPDASAASVSGTCTDLAGNSGTGSLDLKYDSTPPNVDAAPDRAPDSNGWYNHALSIAFTGTDSMSGGVRCDPAVSYSGPDTADGAAAGACTDAAGNVANASFPFEFDATAPSVILTASRAPDSGGFYNHPVSFTATALDGMSGGPVCSGPVAYAGPDSTSATVTATCTDAAGNTGTGSASLEYDTTPPDTMVNNTPPSLTNVPSTSFTFTSTGSGSTFVCTVDGTTGGCSSPFGVTAADGNHTFTVAATDAAGNVDPTPATYSWTVDTVAPDTSFTSTPDPITNQASAFALASPDPTATFECSLDGAAFTTCAANVSLGTPADGSHTFRARAVDPAGNRDATPATYTWATDTTPPTVTYTAVPPALVSSTSATFNWTSGEPATYSCKLDAGSFSSCGSVLATSGTKTLNSLAQGGHTFSVRATDAAGNRTTAVVNWTVDTGAPDTDLVLPLPANPTAATSSTFAFTATEPNSTFRCKLDASAYAACNTGTVSYTGLADGSHTFSVFATDAAGNADSTPATWTWSVDATPPTGSFTAPVAGATVSGNSVTLTVAPADNVSVLGVQLKLDGAPLGAEIVASPYSLTWDTTVVSDGSHTLTADIRDEVGNVTTIGPLQLTVKNAAALPAGTVDVGPGFVDATTRQEIRTSAGRAYIIAADDTAATNNPVHTATGPGVIRAYKGNTNGVPTAFSEVDGAHRPTSGGATKALPGADVRLGNDGVARVLFSDNSFGTPLLMATFSTSTDTWGASIETIASNIGALGRGRLTYALALDSTDVPHVVYVKSGTLFYVNRIGGSWSTPVAIASGTPVHPMLAFDRTGVLHLSWLDDTSGATAIKYARRGTDGTWSAPENVASSDVLTNINADQGPSIAVDASNNPYVLYVSASKGTFGPAGHTAQYGAIRIKKRIGGSWIADDPTPDVLTHTPQIFMRGDDVYAFNGHDTDINFGYAYQLSGQPWSAATKLTTLFADGSANIRWDPLHETDSSIIDAAFFNEDRLENDSFLPELYYRAVTPSTAPAGDTTPPSVSLTAPAAGIVSGTTTVSATTSDNVGVVGLQFKLDGGTLGSELTASPYGYSWDTTSVANGTHTLTASARDAAGNSTTSATVTVDVENTVTPPPPPPATLFGDSTILTHLDNNVAGDVEAFAVNATSSGSLAHLSVYLDSPVPSSLAVGLYSDSGTAPATLVASKSLSTLASGWNSFDLGPVALTAGARYWVALLVPSGATGVVNFRDGHTGPSAFYGGHGLSALPPVWPGGSTSNDGPASSYGTT